MDNLGLLPTEVEVPEDLIQKTITRCNIIEEDRRQRSCNMVYILGIEILHAFAKIEDNILSRKMFVMAKYV